MSHDNSTVIAPRSDPTHRIPRRPPRIRQARGDHGRPAPVIMVSDRMFLVEQSYRPFEESREYELNDATLPIRDGSVVNRSGDTLGSAIRALS